MENKLTQPKKVIYPFKESEVVKANKLKLGFKNADYYFWRITSKAGLHTLVDYTNIGPNHPKHIIVVLARYSIKKQKKVIKMQLEKVTEIAILYTSTKYACTDDSDLFIIHRVYICVLNGWSGLSVKALWVGLLGLRTERVDLILKGADGLALRMAFWISIYNLALNADINILILAIIEDVRELHFL